jgi:dephospho-CoA kinase
MEHALVRIGLTGGVGSGKSSVAELLREAGVDVVNLDILGREVTESSSDLAEKIAAICGPAVLRDGRLDRNAVREVIFADPAKRVALERLLHPLIWSEFQRRCDDITRAGRKLVVCEAALLVESGLHKDLDGLVLVSAPETARKQRVMDRDRINALLAEKMIRSQLGEEERRRPATIVIENNGSLGELAFKVSELLDGWRAKGWVA